MMSRICDCDGRLRRESSQRLCEAAPTTALLYVRPAKVLLLEALLRLVLRLLEPGMTRRAPSRTTLELGRWFARAIVACATPYRAAMPLSVSPRTTRWVRVPFPLPEPPPAPGTLREVPAMIRLPLPGSRLASTSLATVVWYLAAIAESVSPCLIV